MYDTFLQEVIQLDFLPIGIIVFLLMFLKFNDAYEHELTTRFNLPVILLLCLVIVDNIDYYVIDTKNSGMFHVLIAVLGYDLRLNLMTAVVFMAVRRVKVKHKLLIVLPTTVNMILLTFAFFTHWVFWYEDGVVRRGFLAFTPHVVCLTYAVILYFIGSQKYKNSKENEAQLIWVATTLTLLAVLAEMIWQLRGILIGVIALDIMCYYLYFHIEHFKYDPMTEALNRESFEAFIEKDRFKINAVMSIDMNNLKRINDTQGHKAGDAAIMGTVRGIQKSLPRGCDLYRVGGDEFVVLVLLNKIDLKELTQKIQKNVEAEGQSAAVGYYWVSLTEDFDYAYREADNLMYQNKKKLKEKLAQAHV